MSERRPPEDLFKSLLAYEHDEPNARPIEELTDAERDAELATFGVDAAALKARGAAHADKILAQLGAPPAEDPHVAQAQPAVVVPIVAAPVAHATWAWAAAALIAAAIAAKLVLGGHDDPAPPAPRPEPVPAPTESAPAPKVDLLVDARDAYERKDWAACIVALDRAHAIDPTADRRPEALDMRKNATEALRAERGSDDAGKKRPR